MCVNLYSIAQQLKPFLTQETYTLILRQGVAVAFPDATTLAQEPRHSRCLGMKELKLAMPRNQGWASFLTKVAKSTQLKTKDVRDVLELKAADVKGVLAAAHAIAMAERDEGREVIMP